LDGMRKFLWIGPMIVATYFVAWTAAYVAVMGIHFDWFLRYFRLAWKFEGLEMPTIVWALSIVLFLSVRRRSKSRGASSAE
jgi:hypothetical protein